MFGYILCLKGWKESRCDRLHFGNYITCLIPVVLSYHVITQLFFVTWLGKKLKIKLVQKFGDVKTEEQVSLVVQNNNKDVPVTYSEVESPTREEESQSLSDNFRRKNTTKSISGSADYKENELKPIEQKVTDSSTPYILMK